MATRGRKPSPRVVNFYVTNGRKEYRALRAKFDAIQSVFLNAAQMKVEQASKLAKVLAGSFGVDYRVSAEGFGYDFSLTVRLGEAATLEIEQART